MLFMASRFIGAASHEVGQPVAFGKYSSRMRAWNSLLSMCIGKKPSGKINLLRV
jgi:hypothetical protein